MAPYLTEWLAAPIRTFDTIDSTNNYAMMQANADTARPGTTIVAARQTAGKGQRGRQWADAPGESLLMSVIVKPQTGLDGQFSFLAATASAVVEEVGKILPNAAVSIKWPNDIYVNDRKAGGILIENVLRGSQWTHAVVGLGLNVRQASFPPDLPAATSLLLNGAAEVSVEDLVRPLRRAILAAVLSSDHPGVIMSRYNSRMYRLQEMQTFFEAGAFWEGRILMANGDGTLAVQQEDGLIRRLRHGEAEWVTG